MKMTEKPMPRLVSPKRLAEQLDVSRRLIDRLQAEGKITAYHLSPRCVRFDPNEVMAAIEAGLERGGK